jgi:hypothetical protein
MRLVIRKYQIFALLLITPFIGSCGLFDYDVSPTSIASSYSMAQSEGWSGDFSDYPLYREEDMGLESGFRPLPAPFDTTRKSYYIAGTNLGEDLFLFAKTRMENLREGTRYRLNFEATVAINSPDSCGSDSLTNRGEIYIKAGASFPEPVPIQDNDRDSVRYRLNIDKGRYGHDGSNAVVLGSITSGSTCDPVHPYRLYNMESAGTVTVEADANGSVWIFIGTETSYNGRTSVYYTRFHVNASRIN